MAKFKDKFEVETTKDEITVTLRNPDVTDGKCPHCGAVLMISDTLGPDSSDDSILIVMHCKKIIRVSLPKDNVKLISKVATAMNELKELATSLEGEL